jgi:glycosyltransferase involved in cell wall biosynthesis
MKTRVLQNLPINPEKLQVIPFGMDTETFCPLTTTTRSNLRAKYLISNGTFVVFINAHNDEIKGIKIVRELVSITNKLKNVLFILIDESKIFLLDENVLAFRRITSEQKMVDLLNLADLVVVPSLGESFSLLALEAMSCGKAVVTLENSAPHEVTDSSLLFTFTGRNAAQGIYKIIEKTSNDATIVKVEGERNRERVLNRFTIEKHVMEISKLYLRVGENN